MTGRVDYVNGDAAPAHPIPYANTVKTATDFINTQVAAYQPFLLWCSPYLPHDPFDPPAGLKSQYTALGLNDADANFYANIERLDGGVDAILDHLDTKGIANNTILMFICDNGRQLNTPITAGKPSPLQRLHPRRSARVNQPRHQQPATRNPQPATLNPQLVSDLAAEIVNWYNPGTNDFSSWISDPAFGIVMASRGFDLDPDRDGLSNGIEAWLGTHPGAFTPGLGGLGDRRNDDELHAPTESKSSGRSGWLLRVVA